MALGPGKYDDAATFVRETWKAQGAVVIVIDGMHGSGFSVQGNLALQLRLPQLLRLLANSIEADASTHPPTGELND